jgi:hypothetical protein
VRELPGHRPLCSRHLTGADKSLSIDYKDYFLLQKYYQFFIINIYAKNRSNCHFFDNIDIQDFSLRSCLRADTCLPRNGAGTAHRQMK